MPNRVDIPIDAITEEVAALSEEICEVLAKDILNRAKVSTAFTDRKGKLRKSGRVKKSKFDDGGRIVSFSAPHAHLVENGHQLVKGKNGVVVGHVAAHPFLAPAVQAVTNEMPTILQGVVDNFDVTVT